MTDVRAVAEGRDVARVAARLSVTSLSGRCEEGENDKGTDVEKNED